MNAMAIIQLLNMVPQFIAAGMSVADSYAKVRAKADQFVAEGRDPTPAEWDALNAEISALRAELHKAA